MRRIAHPPRRAAGPLRCARRRPCRLRPAARGARHLARGRGARGAARDGRRPPPPLRPRGVGAGGRPRARVRFVALHLEGRDPGTRRGPRRRRPRPARLRPVGPARRPVVRGLPAGRPRAHGSPGDREGRPRRQQHGRGDRRDRRRGEAGAGGRPGADRRRGLQPRTVGAAAHGELRDVPGRLAPRPPAGQAPRGGGLLAPGVPRRLSHHARAPLGVPRCRRPPGHLPRHPLARRLVRGPAGGRRAVAAPHPGPGARPLGRRRPLDPDRPRRPVRGRHPRRAQGRHPGLRPRAAGGEAGGSRPAAARVPGGGGVPRSRDPRRLAARRAERAAPPATGGARRAGRG